MQKMRKTTDSVVPVEICVMINVIFSSKNRATKLVTDPGEVRGVELWRLWPSV